MIETSPFLTGEDLEDFSKPGRFRARSITALSQQATPVTEELAASIVNNIRNLEYRSGRWLGCYCITVRSDDGMSWSAEAARRKIISTLPSFRVVTLPSRETGDPVLEIGQLIGETNLLRTAVDHKIAKWYPTLRPYQVPLLVAAIFVIGILIAIGTGVLKFLTPSAAGQAGLFAHPAFWIVAGLMGLAPVVSKLVADHISVGQKEKSIQLFRDHIEEFERVDEPPKTYSDFIEDVAKKLGQTSKARVVIIDNYEKVNQTARRSIQRYLQSFSERAASSEFWLIFEWPNGQTFSQIAREDRDGYGFKQTKFWQQEPLEPNVLRELAISLGRTDEPTFTSVKWVCRGTPAGNKRTVTFLEEYRRDHPFKPERYGDLDFLYLLSMTATSGEIAFRRDELSSLLSQKQLDRSEVLKLILRGSGLTLDEFRTRLRELEQSFKPFITTEGDGPNSVIGFLPETANVLQTVADRFQLADKGLLHLYWALYWYNYCQRKPREAYLLRKLIHHVTLCDTSQCPAPLARQLNGKLFEALIYAVRQSLRTCLFKDLIKLLERALVFHEMKTPQERIRSQARLFEQCWDVYSILGDESVLALLLRFQQPSPEPVKPATHTRADKLEQLFAETTFLTPELIGKLKAAFDDWKTNPREVGTALRYNAIARAGWLLCSVAILRPAKDMEQALLSHDLSSVLALAESFDRTSRKLVEEKSALPMLTDVATLSLSLWSLALLTISTLPDGESMIKMAESAMIVAAELKGQTFGSNMDVILYALSREVAAVTMAAVLTVYHWVTRFRELPPESLDAFKRIIADGRALFSSKEQRPVTDDDLKSRELIMEVDTLLSESSFIWARFELDRLRDFANLRRLQYNFFGLGLRPDDQTATAPLIDFVSSGLADDTAMGLLANCIVAGCFHKVAELSTPYLLQATQIAIDGQCGDMVRNELALLTLQHGHTLGFNFELCLKTLVQTGTKDQSFLRRFLGVVPSSEYAGRALTMLNAAKHIKDAGLAVAVRQTVAEVAQLQPDGPEKQETLALLQMEELRRLQEKGVPLPGEEELLSSWETRRNLWLYPSLLSLLIGSGHAGEKTTQEAFSCLDHDAALDSSNTNLLLAMDLGRRFPGIKANEPKRWILVRYLKKAILRWEENQTSEINMNAYRLLYQLDANNREEYVPSLIKWEKIKIKRDHLKRLRELADQQKYLLLFRAYYDSAVHWGLECDTSEDQRREFDQLNTEQRTELLASWIKEGAPIPDPIVANRKSSISARFLEIGQLLFSPPNVTNPKYSEQRATFDDVARKRLPDLVEMILGLPQMPQEIRQLLSYHSFQLLTYARLIDARLPAAPAERRNRLPSVSRRAGRASIGE